MSFLVEIKPSPDRDGFCLRMGTTGPVWFAFEHLAVAYAQEAFPTREIVVYEGEDVIKRRYAPVRTE